MTYPVATTPTFSVHNHPTNRNSYHVEIDGRGVGPYDLTHSQALAVARWLELAWEELP